MHFKLIVWPIIVRVCSECSFVFLSMCLTHSDLSVESSLILIVTVLCRSVYTNYTAHRLCVRTIKEIVKTIKIEFDMNFSIFFPNRYISVMFSNAHVLLLLLPFIVQYLDENHVSMLVSLSLCVYAHVYLCTLVAQNCWN